MDTGHIAGTDPAGAVSAGGAAPVRNLDSIKKMLSDDWETVYHTFSDQEKNVFWKSFVQSITVHEDGEMDIVFL